MMWNYSSGTGKINVSNPLGTAVVAIETTVTPPTRSTSGTGVNGW